MAYLFELTIGCQGPGCSSKATVTLLDWENQERGRYCRRCGQRAMKKRQRFEDTHNRDGSTRTAEVKP